MKISELTEKERKKITESGDVAMPKWYREDSRLVDAYRRGYSYGFVAGCEFKANKEEKKL